MPCLMLPYGCRHDAPVMELGVHSNGQIISGACALLATPNCHSLLCLPLSCPQPRCMHLLAGDRSGNVILWDTAAADVSWRMKGVHRGHVTSLVWADASDPYCAGLFLSGGQDGCACGAGQGMRSTQCATSPSGTEACSGA